MCKNCQFDIAVAGCERETLKLKNTNGQTQRTSTTYTPECIMLFLNAERVQRGSAFIAVDPVDGFISTRSHARPSTSSWSGKICRVRLAASARGDGVKSQRGISSAPVNLPLLRTGRPHDRKFGTTRTLLPEVTAVSDNGAATSAGTDDTQWSVDAAKTLYRIDSWGEPYFTLNSNGNLVVRPCGGTSLIISQFAAHRR
eukprot:7032356-Pyramimonas_sp.AAC.1